MPDATGEWLVEFEDLSKHTAYERFANVNDAIPFLHKVLGTGQRPRLYRETPITLTIDVGGEAPVKSPRRRRKKEAKEDGGAAVPHAEATPPDQGSASPVPEAVRTAGPDPVGPFSCEARFDGDPACPGPAEIDAATRGRFCPLHMAIPYSARLELHRRHSSRNRPVRVAHAG